ncbi:hypothetical protein MSHI_38280 [Mycobacterium shinjukuense]|uniref:Uncharacterized protein n=1 Tax=Mycobacterium shinjukuense TaxID=398694 RepID=A0A7I7MVN4_9MYCO|nr:hypothetical protein MSHI_38280 [Mycobacterium shinjukuense]
MRKVHVPTCLTRLTRSGTVGICDVPAYERHRWLSLVGGHFACRQYRVHVGQMSKVRRLEQPVRTGPQSWRKAPAADSPAVQLPSRDTSLLAGHSAAIAATTDTR